MEHDPIRPDRIAVTQTGGATLIDHPGLAIIERDLAYDFALLLIGVPCRRRIAHQRDQRSIELGRELGGDLGLCGGGRKLALRDHGAVARKHDLAGGGVHHVQLKRDRQEAIDAAARLC
jgi:hypothetical protein